MNQTQQKPTTSVCALRAGDVDGHHIPKQRPGHLGAHPFHMEPDLQDPVSVITRKMRTSRNPQTSGSKRKGRDILQMDAICMAAVGMVDPSHKVLSIRAGAKVCPSICGNLNWGPFAYHGDSCPLWRLPKTHSIQY